jgi:hypothetical protein
MLILFLLGGSREIIAFALVAETAGDGQRVDDKARARI